MSNRINNANLLLVFGLFLTVLSCGFLPKSECELTEADGTSILGANVVRIDKNSSAFGDPATAKNDKNFRACGYIHEKPDEQGNLYWAQTHSENLAEAKRLFGIVTEKLPDAEDRSIENLDGIGEEARLSRFKHTDSNKLEIAVRKGNNVILLTISKPSEQEIPIETVKLLAKRLADKTSD